MKAVDATDAPQGPQDPPRRLWKWVRRLAAAAFFLAVALVATAWFSRDWLAARSNAILKAELSRRHVYADYGASRFSMLRGLVFSDVTVHRTAEKNDPVLSISDLAIAFDPVKLLRRKPVAPRITAHEAMLVAHHARRPAELSNLELHATVLGDRVVIEQLDGRIANFDVAFTGDIATSVSGTESAAEAPAAEKARTPGGIAAVDLSPVARFLEVLAVTPRGDAPVVSAHVVRDTGGRVSATGTLSGSDFSWRGLALDSLNLTFSTDGDSASLIRFPSLDLGYGGRRLHAAGSYALGSRVITLAELRSDVDLIALLSAISPEWSGALAAFRLLESPAITLAGTLPATDPVTANLAGTVKGGGIAIALNGGKELVLTEITADLSFREGTLHTPNLAAECLGGQAALDASLRPLVRPMHLDCTLSLSDLSLQEITVLAGAARTMPGTLHATFKGGGAPSLTGLRGGGSLTMAGAKMISVPVFRKLVPLLKTIIPGLSGEQAGTKMTASYRLENGVFSSGDIHLEDGMVIVDGATSIDLGKRYLTATAKAKTGGATQIITALAGKALEIEAEGPFDDFSWRFKNLSALGKLNDLAGGLLNGGTAEAAGSVVKEGVTGIGGAAGSLLNGLKKAAGGEETPDDEKKNPSGGLRKILPGKGSN